MKTTNESHSKPRLLHGVYYWPEYTDARAYAESVGVSLYSRKWPKAVRYTAGWAIQLSCSGPYLGPQHVAIRTSDGKIA